MNSNKKIYWILLLLSLAGYAWVGFYAAHPYRHDEQTVCLFKNVTGLPCPSCGTTRSLLSILQGDLHQAVVTNPLGFVAALLLVVVPAWVAADWYLKRNSLLDTYYKAEQAIKNHKAIYLPLIALAILNWIWNITKGL